MKLENNGGKTYGTGEKEVKVRKNQKKVGGKKRKKDKKENWSLILFYSPSFIYSFLPSFPSTYTLISSLFRYFFPSFPISKHVSFFLY